MLDSLVDPKLAKYPESEIPSQAFEANKDKKSAVSFNLKAG